MDSVDITVTVGLDYSIQSSDSDLSEGPADITTGAVSVTYSPQISLQRKHNGQQAVCTVMWRNTTVTSDNETVDVRCKYFICCIINSLQRKHNGQQAVCTVVWRETTEKSESETVDVRCMYSTLSHTNITNTESNMDSTLHVL